MSLRSLTVLATLTALSLAAVAQSRPLTTVPSLALNVDVTITGMRIVLDRHSAPRGVDARFIIKNETGKAHNFTLSGGKTATGARQGFSRTLKPHQREIVLRFLDFRGRFRYFGGLPADRGKPGMNGFFVIR
jgi:hypothetical protein